MNGTEKRDHEREFILKLTNLALDEAWEAPQNPDSPVVRFKTPGELMKCMDFSLPNEPTNQESLIGHCQDVLHYSVKTGHPRFFNQLFCGLDSYGFAGQILTDALNGAMYTYETAPVFILMEKILLQKLRAFVGYEDGGGTMCPGGTYSNMLAMNLARFSKSPRVKEEGLFMTQPMVIYTSEQSHYSISKSASLIGLGSNHVKSVKCDEKGKMMVKDLEEHIKKTLEKGHTPFMVNATAGTTVLGAFDPIDEIADVCKRYDLWLHVDAAWGGSCLISDKHRHLCKGIERSDSVTWNPHKMLMVPQQCSVILLKNKNIMRECHSLRVPYLFQTDKKNYDSSFDIGKDLIQCGRKVDVLKFWVMWKAHGTSGFKKQIDQAFDTASYLISQINQRAWFKLVIKEPECTNVSFWFIPPSLRDLCTFQNGEIKFPEEDNEAFLLKLAQIAPEIKMRMQKAGSMLITYTGVGRAVNFFRMVVINTNVTYSDMDFVLDEIERLGQGL